MASMDVPKSSRDPRRTPASPAADGGVGVGGGRLGVDLKSEEGLAAAAGAAPGLPLLPPPPAAKAEAAAGSEGAAAAAAPLPLPPPPPASQQAAAQCALCQHGAEAAGALGQLLTFKCGSGSKVQNRLAHWLCAQWAPRAHWAGDKPGAQHGLLLVPEEVRRAAKMRCKVCRRTGAAMGCEVEACRQTFHLPCAMMKDGAAFDTTAWTVYCPTHAQRCQAGIGSADMQARRQALLRVISGARPRLASLLPPPAAQAASRGASPGTAAAVAAATAAAAAAAVAATAEAAAGAVAAAGEPGSQPPAAEAAAAAEAEAAEAASPATAAETTPAGAGQAARTGMQGPRPAPAPAAAAVAGGQGEAAQQADSRISLRAAKAAGAAVQAPAAKRRRTIALPVRAAVQGAPAAAAAAGQQQQAVAAEARQPVAPVTSVPQQQPTSALRPSSALDSRPASSVRQDQQQQPDDEEQQEQEQHAAPVERAADAAAAAAAAAMGEPASVLPPPGQHLAQPEQQQQQLAADVRALVREVFGDVTPDVVPLAEGYLWQEGVRSFSDLRYVDTIDFADRVPCTKMMYNKFWMLQQERAAAAPAAQGAAPLPP